MWTGVQMYISCAYDSISREYNGKYSLIGLDSWYNYKMFSLYSENCLHVFSSLYHKTV